MKQILGDKLFVTRMMELEREGSTGVLRVRAEGVCTEAHVRSGVVVFAAGGLPSDSVARELVRRRVISSQDYRTVVEQRMTLQGRRRFGDVAMELGLLTEQALGRVLQDQVQQKLARCLHWDRTLIEFERTSDVMPLPADGGARVEQVLVEAARRHYSPSRVRARVGASWDQKIHFTDQSLDGLKLDDKDLARVEQLRAAASPSALASTSESDRDLSTLLVSLWLLGAVDLPVVTTEVEEEPEGGFEGGLGGSFGVRSSRDRLLADGAYLQGRELFVQGEYDAAADAYNTAVELRPRAREYVLAHAWARFLADGGDEVGLAELEGLCEAALAQDRRLGLAYHVRGNLALKSGNREAAMRYLTWAVHYDPSDEVSAHMLEQFSEDIPEA